MKKVTLINIISSVLLQIFTIIYGFIIPKIIIDYFGSEVNGLVSSITQFLSYISLLEGGVTAVIIAKLYKPLVENDNKKISSIIVTANKFYKKIGICFIFYSIILAFLYPIVFNKFNFDYIYVFSLTLILSISLVIQYMLSLGIKCLLSADKKIYIVSFTQTIIIILNIFLAIISVKIYPSIHIFKFLTGITYFMQPIIFNIVVQKKYKINKKSKYDTSLIEDRWNGFANNIAYFIHTSTDISILTIFTNLVTVSVYSVYSLVTSGIKSLIGAINNGIFPTIGQLYAKGNKDELNEKFDLYEIVYLSIVFFVATITILLITPFVEIYVGSKQFILGYNQPLFGIIIVIVTLLDLAKIPHVNLSYSANKFKELTVPCFIEAFINITVSIVLVKKIGLVGVAIGTLIAMLYRLFYQVSFTEKIICRKKNKFWKTFIVLSLSSIISLFLCYKFIPIKNISVIKWVLYGLVYSIITLLVFLISLFIIIDKKKIKKLFLKLKKGKINDEKFN